jgi:hypothetical protein
MQLHILHFKPNIKSDIKERTLKPITKELANILQCIRHCTARERAEYIIPVFKVPHDTRHNPSEIQLHKKRKQGMRRGEGKKKHEGNGE